MATSNNSMSVAQPYTPIFKSLGYAFWSIKIKTLFKSQDIWELVKNGYPNRDDEDKLQENRKKDSKELFFIQQVVHESIFSRIIAITMVKEAWNILQIEFQGDSKVLAIKLHTLRCDFENTHMKKWESV